MGFVENLFKIPPFNGCILEICTRIKHVTTNVPTWYLLPQKSPYSSHSILIVVATLHIYLLLRIICGTRLSKCQLVYTNQTI